MTDTHCKICGQPHPTGACTEHRDLRFMFGELLQRLETSKSQPATGTKREQLQRNFEDTREFMKFDLLLKIHRIMPDRVPLAELESTLDTVNVQNVIQENNLNTLLQEVLELLILQGDTATLNSLFQQYCQAYPDQAETMGKILYLRCALRHDDEAHTHANAVIAILEEAKLTKEQIDAIKMHGRGIPKKDTQTLVRGLAKATASFVKGMERSLSLDEGNSLIELLRKRTPEYSDIIDAATEDTSSKKYDEGRDIGLHALNTLIRDGDYIHADRLLRRLLTKDSGDIELHKIRFHLAELTRNTKEATKACNSLCNLALPETEKEKYRTKLLNLTSNEAKIETPINKEQQKQEKQTDEGVAAKIRAMLRKSYLAGKQMLGAQLREKPNDPDLLRIGFDMALKENNEAAAQAFLKEIKRTISQDQYEILRLTVAEHFYKKERQQGKPTQSSILDNIATRRPINKLAGQVAGWQPSSKKEK